MRNRYDTDLLRELDQLNLPAAPLSADEFDRVLAKAEARLPDAEPAVSGRARQPRRPRLLRWLGRTGAAAAACAVLLCGVNAVNPALAEDLPLVGGAFAWANRNANVRMRSEQLDQYATPLDAPATAEASAPYGMTLSQAYFDGEWLRLSVVLTAEDDSLTGFDEIRPMRPEQRADPTVWPDDREGYGDLVLADGSLMGPEGSTAFTKQDDRTFVLQLSYPVFLRQDPASLAGQQLTLVLRDLVGYNVENLDTDYDEYGVGGATWDMTNETDLPGVYTMTFTVPAADAAGVRTATGADEATGITVEELRATPAATKLVITVPNTPVEDIDPEHITPLHNDEFRLRTADGTPLKPERAEGMPVDEAGSAYRYTAYFDAAPEDADAIEVLVLQDGEEYASLTLPLTSAR